MSTFRNLGKGSFKITTKDKFNLETMEEGVIYHVAGDAPILFRGAYEAATTYNKNDAVAYGSYLFVCLRDGVVNRHPVPSEASDSSWINFNYSTWQASRIQASIIDPPSARHYMLVTPSALAGISAVYKRPDVYVESDSTLYDSRGQLAAMSDLEGLGGGTAEGVTGNNTRITFGNGIKEAPADVLIERGGELALKIQSTMSGIFLEQMTIAAEVIKEDAGDAYKTATYDGFDIDSYLNDKYYNDADIVDMLKKYFFDKFVEQNSILNALAITVMEFNGEPLRIYEQEYYKLENGAFVSPAPAAYPDDVSLIELSRGDNCTIRIRYGSYWHWGDRMLYDYVPTMTVDVPNNWDYLFPNGTYTMTDLSCFAGQTLKLTFSYVDESFGLTGPVPLLLSIDEE